MLPGRANLQMSKKNESKWEDFGEKEIAELQGGLASWLMLLQLDCPQSS